MRTMKIVADSSANMISLDAVSFASAPLKVITDGREFVDDAAANANEMLQYFDTYKGKSKSGEYILCTDKDGYIKNISIEGINFSADFINNR